MANALLDLSTAQLERAVELRRKIDGLQSELEGLFGTAPAALSADAPRRGRKKFSAATRRKMAAAQRARGGNVNVETDAKPARKPDRRMSAAVKALLSKRAKLRWKKAKAAGRSRL